MADYEIIPIPDDAPEPEVIITSRQESVEYEITDAGKLVDRVDTSGPDMNALSKEEIAERVLRRKAMELHIIRRMLKDQTHKRIRAAEKKKQKSKNRKRNKLARQARKRNK
jgi:hypothetical protein